MYVYTYICIHTYIWHSKSCNESFVFAETQYCAHRTDYTDQETSPLQGLRSLTVLPNYLTSFLCENVIDLQYFSNYPCMY